MKWSALALNLLVVAISECVPYHGSVPRQSYASILSGVTTTRMHPNAHIERRRILAENVSCGISQGRLLFALELAAGFYLLFAFAFASTRQGQFLRLAQM